MKNIRIGTRVALSYAIVVALIIGLATFTWEMQASIGDSLKEQATLQLERNALAQEWRQNIAVNGQRTTAIAMSSDKSLQKVFEADMKDVSTRTAEVQKRFAEVETTSEGKQFQDELAGMRKRAFAGREAILAANAAGDAEGAIEAAQKYKQTIVDYIAVADRLVAFENQRSKSMADDSLRLVGWTQSATQVAALATALAAIGLGWLLTRSIVRPLRSAQEAANAVAQGDLRAQVEVTRGDELGQLQQSLAGMQTSLSTLVANIRHSADSIDVASDEVAQGNQDLSVRTEQTAARLQETASAMEQLATTVKASSDSVHTATTLSTTAREAASQSSKAVVDVVATMRTISDSSNRIAEITGVIDSIAFQTNLLALNAAVEAARAGDQGRGFAVVAAEVRALAKRSAEAAKEIKGLVAASLENIEAGSQHANVAGARMDDVTRTFKRVDDIVSEIAAAAAEQAQGVAAVTRAVAEIDQSTQQNAALVEESAAAARSLRDQASAMTSAVQQFKIAA